MNYLTKRAVLPKLKGRFTQLIDKNKKYSVEGYKKNPSKKWKDFISEFFNLFH